MKNLRLIIVFLLAIITSYSAHAQVPVIDSVSTSPQICTGSTTGSSITVYAQGTNLAYSLTGPVSIGPQASNIFPDVPAGTYSVTVTNGSGSDQETGIVILDQSSNLQLPNLQSFQTICPGDSNGYVVVNAIGGLAPYNFQLTAGPVLPPAITSNGTDTIYGLSASINYNIEVSDACGQQVNLGFEIEDRTLGTLPKTTNVAVYPADSSQLNCDSLTVYYLENKPIYSENNQAYPLTFTFHSLDGLNADVTVIHSSFPAQLQSINLPTGEWRYIVEDFCGRVDSTDFDFGTQQIIVNTGVGAVAGSCSPSFRAYARFYSVGFSIKFKDITNCDKLEVYDDMGLLVLTLDHTSQYVDDYQWIAPESLLPGPGTYTFKIINTCCNDTLSRNAIVNNADLNYNFFSFVNNVGYDSTAGVEIRVGQLPQFDNYFIWDSIVGPSFYIPTPGTANNYDTVFGPILNDTIPLPDNVNKFRIGSFPIGTYYFRLGNTFCNVEDTFAINVTENELIRFSYEAEYIQKCEGLSELQIVHNSTQDSKGSISVRNQLNQNIGSNNNIGSGDTLLVSNLSSSSLYTIKYERRNPVLEVFALSGESGVFYDTLTTPPQPFPQVDSIATICTGSDSSWVYIYATGVAPFQYAFRLSGEVSFSPYQYADSFYLPNAAVFEFMVEDTCGNSSAIYSELVCPPPCDSLTLTVFNGPIDTLINCTADTTQNLFGEAVVDFTCCPGEAVITYMDSLVPGACAGEDTIFRIWEAYDLCGNYARLVQTIHRVDTIPPSFDSTPPTDTIVVSCYQDIPPAEVITATDNCGIAQVIVDENRVEGGCSGQFTIERTWAAIDECNNITVSDTQYVVVNDTVAPIFNEALPNDTIISCSDSIPVADTLTAYDCTDGNIYNIPALTNDYYLDMGKIIPLYNSDNDGFGVLYENVSVASLLQDGTPQAILEYYDTIYVSLTTSPVAGTNGQNVKRNNFGYRLLNSIVTLTFSQDVTFQVSGNPSLDPKEKLTFSGDGNLLYPFPESGGTNWGEDWIEPDILTTISDPYIVYNSGTVTYTRAAQVFGGTGTNLTFQQENPNGAIAQLFVSVFEPKSNVSAQVDFSETISPGSCPSNYVITRTWTATDSCGNQNVHTQTITVQDTLAPVFDQVLPTDTLVSCDAIPTAMTLTATDNCSDVDVAYTEDTLQGGCLNNYTLTRTWTATDSCGNQTIHVQTVTVQDTVAPVFDQSLPTDTLVNCDAVPTAMTLTATDNCSDVDVAYTEDTLQGGCLNNYTLTRTWIATDSCGNQTIHVQTVTVQDTVAPVFDQTLPTDTLVNCDAVPTAEILTATDNCSDVDVAFTEDTLQGGCLNNYTLTRTWTATDSCGNQTIHVQTVTVQDTVAPVFDQAVLPSDTTVSCDAIPTPAVLTASDNCSAVSIVMVEDTVSGTCPTVFTLTRTWTASDSCGNFVSHSQVINVIDTLAPIFSTYPSDTVLNNDTDLCSAVLNWTEPLVSDNCGGITLVSSHANGSSFPVGTTDVVYVATDDCGNADSITFSVTVVDVQKPNVSIQVSPSFCEGDAVSWVEMIDDNCGVDTITSSHSMTDDFAVGTTTVTYTVTDIHGNDSTYTFDVVVTPLPVVEFVQSDVLGCLTDDILLEVNNPNTDYTFDWMFDGMYIGSGPYYTINSSEYTDAGVYSVEVYTNEGCIDTFDISVALELCDIVIVETFSPNGDGINDYFTIDNIEAYPGTSVKIFNRWGALVFESDNYLNEWDGTSMNSLNIGGNELPEGTYYYILQLSGNEDELYKGYVYLKR